MAYHSSRHGASIGFGGVFSGIAQSDDADPSGALVAGIGSAIVVIPLFIGAALLALVAAKKHNALAGGLRRALHLHERRARSR